MRGCLKAGFVSVSSGLSPDDVAMLLPDLRQSYILCIFISHSPYSNQEKSIMWSDYATIGYLYVNSMYFTPTSNFYVEGELLSDVGL